MTPAQLEVIKSLPPGLLRISRGLNLMLSVRCCMEDKASCSACSSKDFNSLISTNSATLAPLEILLGSMLVPWGTSLVMNRLLVFAGSSHGSCWTPLLKSLKQSWLCFLWDPSFGLCAHGQDLPTWQLHCGNLGYVPRQAVGHLHRAEKIVTASSKLMFPWGQEENQGY